MFSYIYIYIYIRSICRQSLFRSLRIYIERNKKDKQREKKQKSERNNRMYMYRKEQS